MPNGFQNNDGPHYRHKLASENANFGGLDRRVVAKRDHGNKSDIIKPTAARQAYIGY
jgi:hypothetical protein